MTIIDRASKAGIAAQKAFCSRHQGRTPTLENDWGNLDLVWPGVWEVLQQAGATDAEHAACRTSFCDAYFSLQTASAGG